MPAWLRNEIPRNGGNYYYIMMMILCQPTAKIQRRNTKQRKGNDGSSRCVYRCSGSAETALNAARNGSVKSTSPGAVRKPVGDREHEMRFATSSVHIDAFLVPATHSVV